MPVKQSVYHFSCTWSAPASSQPLAHKAFTKVAKKFIYQWERGSTGYVHCQAYLNLRVKSYYTGKPLGKLLCGLGLPGIECRPSSTDGIAALQAYAMKEDTRIAGPWADHPIYRGQDLNMMSSPFPWQKDILDRVALSPNDRKIMWINDEGGNVGKSKLLKFMCYKKLAKRVPLGNATQLKTNVIVQGPARCYCVDMPRTTGTTEKMQDLISTLEEIKNGWVCSAMYGKHQELFMEPPHVIVFSNVPPPLGLMSVDRWEVFKVIPSLKILSRLSRNSNSGFSLANSEAPRETPNFFVR